MTQHTTCFYCGAEGLIISLRYHSRPNTDMHAHNCGTNMLMDHETGEVLDTRRHYWCTRWESLKAEMHTLSTQLYDMIHERDGGTIDESALPF